MSHDAVARAHLATPSLQLNPVTPDLEIDNHHEVVTKLLGIDVAANFLVMLDIEGYRVVKKD